jgi:RNA polymerase sigma-70 factor, ECF subfamily
MNETELQDIWKTYFPRVYGYFFRRVSNRQDVDDLTSIVMTSFIQAKIEKDIDKIESYLWAIARTQLFLFIRNKSKAPVTIEMTEEFDTSSDFENIQAARTLEERLSRLYNLTKNNLTQEEQKIFSLTYQDGYNSVEIGKLLDLKSNTVRQKLSRIISKIKPHLSKI